MLLILPLKRLASDVAKRVLPIKLAINNVQLPYTTYELKARANCRAYAIDKPGRVKTMER